MTRISIASLIYRLPTFADSVWQSLHEFTPMLASGEARFFFVANDPEPELLRHLQLKGYPHVVQINPRYTEAELFAQGYGWPEYISRVYRGWNRAVLESDETCVLVNSDHLFSPNWLENLLAHLDANEKQLVCCQSVEVPGFGGAWPVDFGRTPDTFRKAEFQQLVAERSQPGELRRGGVYMPVAFRRKFAIDAGLYPEGNLHSGAYDRIWLYGDADFFIRMQGRLGIRHVTALDSIVYHFCEGEMNE